MAKPHIATAPIQPILIPGELTRPQNRPDPWNSENRRFHAGFRLGLLEMQGFEVVIAANGIDTLQALSQRGFDLILMDVQIPLMSGIEATIAIGAKEKFTGEHIPIIAVTALDQQ